MEKQELSLNCGAAEDLAQPPDWSRDSGFSSRSWSRLGHFLQSYGGMPESLLFIFWFYVSQHGLHPKRIFGS